MEHQEEDVLGIGLGRPCSATHTSITYVVVGEEYGNNLVPLDDMPDMHHPLSFGFGQQIPKIDGPSAQTPQLDPDQHFAFLLPQQQVLPRGRKAEGHEPGQRRA